MVGKEGGADLMICANCGRKDSPSSRLILHDGLHYCPGACHITKRYPGCGSTPVARESAAERADFDALYQEQEDDAEKV